MIVKENVIPFSSILKELLKSLLRLNKRGQQPDKSSLSTEDIESLVEVLTKHFEVHPFQLLAQINFTRPTIPAYATFQLHLLILGLLVCRRNHWNATSTKELLCGLLTLSIRHQQIIENSLFVETAKPSENQQCAISEKFLSRLKQQNRHIWLSIVEICSPKRILNPGQYLNGPNNADKYLTITYLSLFLAIKSLPLGGKKANCLLHNVYRLSSNLSTHSLNFIEPIMKSIGLLFIGAHCQTKEKDIFIILSSNSTVLTVKKFDRSSKQYSTETNELNTDSIIGFLPPSPIRKLGLIDVLWDVNWYESLASSDASHFLDLHLYRLDAPPKSLENVLEHMEKQDVSIDELCDLISHEPTFVEHLKSSASQASRADVSVKELKHSIVYNGLEKTRSALVQQALVTRLNQHYFPLQDSFFQFLKFWSHVATELVKNDKYVVNEQVCNWVYFCCAGLFTNAELKRQSHWLIAGDKVSGIKELAHCQRPEHFIIHAQKLSESWHQEKELITALRLMLANEDGSASATKSYTYSLLKLSFILSFALYTKGKLIEHEDNELLQQLCHRLSVNIQELPQVAEDSLEKSHIYSSIFNQTRICH